MPLPRVPRLTLVPRLPFSTLLTRQWFRRLTSPMKTKLVTEDLPLVLPVPPVVATINLTSLFFTGSWG